MNLISTFRKLIAVDWYDLNYESTFSVPTFKRHLLMGAIAASCFAATSCSTTDTQARSQDERKLVDALTPVFLEKISSKSEMAIHQGAKICVVGMTNGKDHSHGPHKYEDAPAGLVAELRKTFPKILSYASCADLESDVPTNRYVLEYYEWQADGDLVAGVGFHEGMYGEGQIFRIHKADGKWEVVDSQLHWIS